MRYLFISYNLPGPLGAMASWLARNRQDQVIMASSRSQHDHFSGGVRRVVLKSWQGKLPPDNPGYFDMWMQAARAGKSADASLRAVRDSGFEPDMILVASSNGSALNIEEIFPGSFRVNFLENECCWSADQKAMRRDAQCLQMSHAHMSFAFSAESREIYPPLFRERIELAPLMIDTEFFQPVADGQAPKEDLAAVFCNSPFTRDLRDTWNMCLELLRLRKHCRIVVLPGNAIALRKIGAMGMPACLAGRIRLEFPLRHAILRDILCKASLALFPSSIVDMDLLQAMSCGTAPALFSQAEGLTPGADMCLLKSGTCRERACAIAEAMDDKSRLAAIGGAARGHVLQHYDAAKLMPAFFPRIEKAFTEWQKSGQQMG